MNQKLKHLGIMFVALLVFGGWQAFALEQVIEQTAVSVAADTNGIATATECTGAGPWTPDVATVISDGLAHLITIKELNTVDQSAKTFTVIGTDVNGDALSEALTGPTAGATVTTTGYFLTVTSITVSATISTNTVEVGWAAGSVTLWKTVWFNPDKSFNMTINGTVDSGSPTFGIQYSIDRTAIYTHATFTGKTANFAAQQAFPVRYLRIIFTAAGGVTMKAIR